jgi:hypothetical protein
MGKDSPPVKKIIANETAQFRSCNIAPAEASVATRRSVARYANLAVGPAQAATDKIEAMFVEALEG